MTTNCSRNKRLSDDVAAFDRELKARECDYLLVEQRGDQRVRLKFIGPFQGRDVLWDCEFLTLEAAACPRNFIEIGEPGEYGWPLRVGLRLARIDRPAIDKMIIMIRNYKRLRVGRHEYG